MNSYELAWLAVAIAGAWLVVKGINDRREEACDKMRPKVVKPYDDYEKLYNELRLTCISNEELNIELIKGCIDLKIKELNIK